MCASPRDYQPVQAVAFWRLVDPPQGALKHRPLPLHVAWFPKGVTEREPHVQRPRNSSRQGEVWSHTHTHRGDPRTLDAILHQTNGPMAHWSAW